MCEEGKYSNDMANETEEGVKYVKTDSDIEAEVMRNITINDSENDQLVRKYYWQWYSIVKWWRKWKRGKWPIIANVL